MTTARIRMCTSGKGGTVIGLEGMVEIFDLILNLEIGKTTWSTRRKMTSNLDLTFTTPNIGALET